MANPFDALKSRPAPASPSPFSGGVPGAGMRFTSAPKPVAPAKGFGQGQNVFGGKAAGGVPDRRDVADAGEIKRWITLPNGQVIPIKTPSGSQHLLRTKGSSFFFDPKDNHPYKLDARSPSGIKSAFEDVEAMPDGAGRLVKKVAGQTLDVGEDAAFVAKQAAATAKGLAAEEKKAAEAAKKAESEAKKAEAAGLRTAKAEALVTIGSAKEILAENERQLHLESTSSAKRARMIAEDLRSDGYRLDFVDKALEEASDPQIIENLKKEREGLTALMEGKRKQQETFELDAQRAALREEEYLRGQIGLESELNRKKLAVATMTNTGRLPSVESTTGINAPVATTAPAPTAKPEVPLGQAALDAGEDVSAVVRSIYAQQDSQVEAYRQWRDSVKLDGVMIDRANSPDGAFWDGKRWLDVVPGMKLDTAKEVRAVVLPKVEGMTLAGDEVKVGESRIGEVWRDEAGVPSLLMARNAPGVRSSPSLRSGNPYDGVPEYAEVSPQFIDGLQREGAFAQTGEAIPSEMTRKAQEQWAAQRWDDGQVNGLLTEWRSGNDRDRAEIVKRLQPEAAFAEPNNPQSWRLDTRKLYLGGQISLQQARLLEREFYGVQPGIKPLGKAWEEFKSGESETAQRLAGVVGNKLSSRRQIVGALEQASSAFLADYYKANGHRADFDLAEYNQLRESLAAGEAGSAWWTAQVDNALQNAVGSSAGMLVGVGKFFGTLPQAMGGPKVGMTPEEFGMVSDATLYTGAAMRRNLADRGLFTPSTWWEGKEGKAVTQSIDLLFAKIDNESLTETDFDDLAKEIARSSIQQSQRLGTPDEMQTTPEGWELAREDLLNYYDPSSPQSPLAGLLMAYQATRDPAIRAQFEQMVRSSPDEMEFHERTAAYASAEGTISENDFTGPLRLGFRGGQVAPIQESIVEILSDITTAGMGKALATGVRGAKKVQEAGKAMNIAQRAALGLSRMGERWVQMGLREGRPMQNLLVQGAKQAVTSGIAEGAEEFVGAWGQTGATLKDAFVQGLQGAIGGLGLAPIMGGAGVAVDAFQQMRTQRAEMKGYADFAAQWTKDHPDDPIDAAGVKQMAGYMPPVFRAENAAAMKAAAEQMEQALVAAQQAAKDGPPSPEVMAPIEEAHAAALDTLKGHAAELRLRTVAAKEAMQEINGIADPTHRAFADAALKARMGQKLAPREVSALLNSVDETGQALAEETEGGWRFTEAGLNALAESAPITRESFFPQEESEVTPSPERMEANGTPVSTNGTNQTTNGAPVSTNGNTPTSGQGQAEVSGVPATVPTPDGAVGDESSPAAPTPSPAPSAPTPAVEPASPAPTEEGTMHYVPVKITLPGGEVKTMDLEQMATSPEEAAQRVAQSPVMQAYQRRGATVEVGNTAPAASPAATETRTETSPQSPAPQPAANARNLPQSAAKGVETNTETALPETDLGREEPAAAIAAALASKQATQKAEVRPWRKVLEGVATMFGHKLVDTGLPFGFVDQWGKFHSFGTQLLDKMNPGSEIGQWIDKVGNAAPELAAKIGQSMTQPFFHRVWFGHDPAANVATIVDRFGWGALPEYAGQLAKDFMTKAGVPLPGTQWLVHSGIVGDETATKWLSLNVGEAFSGGLALLGSWKLMKKARNGQEIHAGWAMAGIAFKLVGGVMQANPVLLLSGLSDAVVLTLAKPAAVKAAFEQVAERGDQAEETPETATSEPVAVPEEAKVPWAKDLDFLPAARLYPAMQALEPRLRMMAWDSALRLNATLALYAETFPAGIRFSEKREANLWVNRDGTLNINLPFYLRDTAHTTTREAIMAMVEEELAHIAAMRVMTDTEVVDLWNSLPAAMQRQVYKAYHVSDIAHKRVPSEPKGDWGSSAWNYGHEFVRMLVTDREFQGRVAEAVEVDPGFGAKIVAWLKTFIARLRQGIEALPPAQRSAVKEYEYRVRQALREMLKLPPLQKPTAEQTRSTGQRIEKLRAWMRSQPRDASVWAALTDKGDVLSIPGSAATTPWDARKQLASQARLRGQWLAWDAGLAGLNVPWADVNEELESWQSRSAQQLALLADPSIVESLKGVDDTLQMLPMPTEEDFSDIGPPEIEEAQLQRATLPKQMELGLDPIARRRDLRGKRDLLVMRVDGMSDLVDRKVWDTPEQEAKLRKDLARYEALLAKVEGKMLADYGPGEIERKVDKPVDMQNVNPGQGSKPSPEKAGVAEGPKVDTAAAVGGRGEVRSEKSPAAEGKVPSPADAKAAAIAYQEEVLADAQATEAAKEKARKVLAKLRGEAVPAAVEVAAVSNDTGESAPESVNPTPELAAPAEKAPVSPPPAVPATIGQENINARPSVAWADVSTPGTMSNPNGTLRAAATKSKAPSGVWYFAGDIRQLAFEENATVNGKSGATPSGQQLLAEAKAVQAAGWTYTNVKASGFGTAWVFRKGDQVLTRAGAAALASGKMERPEVQPSEAGYQSMIDRFGAFSAKMVEWLQTLKPSTLDSSSALSNKIGNGLISKWVRLVPNPYSTGERFTLQFLKEDGGAELALYGDTVDRIIEEVVRYAAAWRDRTGEGLDPLFRAISYEEQQANVWRKPSEAMAALGFPAAGEETPVTPPPSATPTTRLQDLNAPELLSPAEWLAAGRSEEEHRKLIREAMGLGKRRPVNAATVAAYEMTPPALYVRKGEQLVYGPLEAKLEEQKRRQGKSKKGDKSPAAEFGSRGVVEPAPVKPTTAAAEPATFKELDVLLKAVIGAEKKLDKLHGIPANGVYQHVTRAKATTRNANLSWAAESLDEAKRQLTLKIRELLRQGVAVPERYLEKAKARAEYNEQGNYDPIQVGAADPVQPTTAPAETALAAFVTNYLDPNFKRQASVDLPGSIAKLSLATSQSDVRQVLQTVADMVPRNDQGGMISGGAAHRVWNELRGMLAHMERKGIDKATPELAPVQPTTAAAETPAKAEAKVEEHLQDVKATEGTRPAAEIKAELLATVTTLLKETRQRAAAETGNGNLSYEQLVKAGHGDLVDNMSFEKREFQIPGDGTFTMVLNGRNLAELLKRIKALPVKDTGKVEAGRGGAGEGTAASAKEVAAKLYTVAAVRSWVVNAINGDPFAEKVIEAYRKTDNPEGIKVDEIEAEVKALLNGDESAPVKSATPAAAAPTQDLVAGVDAAALASPLMKQWLELRKQLPAEVVLLFRLGDFYEAFGSDAATLSEAAEVSLTKRNGIPMAGIPHHSARSYIAKLVKAGHKVALAEQSEENHRKWEVGNAEAEPVEATPTPVVNALYNEALARKAKGISTTVELESLDAQSAKWFGGHGESITLSFEKGSPRSIFFKNIDGFLREPNEVGQAVGVRRGTANLGSTTLIFDADKQKVLMDALTKAGWEVVPKKGPEVTPAAVPVEETPAPTPEAAPVAGPVDKKTPISKKAVETAAAITDFGEVLDGARKHLWGTVATALKMELPAEGADIVMSKHWPEPDYAKLLKAGVNPDVLTTFKALRDAIPPKPRQGYKLRQWADMVRTLHKYMREMIDGESYITPERLNELTEGAGSRLRTKILFYRMLHHLDANGPSNGLLFTEAKDWGIGNGVYSVFNAKRLEFPNTTVVYPEYKGRYLREGNDIIHAVTTSAEQDGALAEMVQKVIPMMLRMRDAAKGGKNDPTAAPKVRFHIYTDRITRDVFIGRPGLTGVVRLKTGFPNSREAVSYLAEHMEELQEQWNGLKEIPDYRRPINAPRQGPSRREGEVTPEMFTEAFGFRGVQFGNYVEGSRRQIDLNSAYDALMDLADGLGIPARALSLDGSLGLAFGARGKGGKGAAAAHYEPGTVVINLTKHGGPGSLAHEWWHALDNYFGRLDRTGKTDPKPTRDYASESRGTAANQMRAEMWARFKAINAVVKNNAFAERSAKLDEARSKPYFSQTIEKTARGFERYIEQRLRKAGIVNDYLVNLLEAEEEATSDTSVPTGEEMESLGIRAAYDALFEVMESKETERGQMLFTGNRAAPALDGEENGGQNAGMASTPGAAQNAEPSPGGLSEAEARNPMTIYRAGDADEVGVKPWASFTPERKTAEAYTDNPGFGGDTVRELRVDAGNTLDLTSGNKFRKLAEALGFEGDEAIDKADEWHSNGWNYPWEESSKVKRALEESEFDAVQYTDDFPSGATTIIFTREPASIDPESTRAGDGAGLSTSNRSAPASPVDAAAQAAAASPLNALAEPTEAQKEAGNYAKGHVRIGGLDISIENPAGSVRRGTNANGKAWETTMQAHYGYVRGTEGPDGDHLDVFIAPGTPAEFRGTVYVVEQTTADGKAFDEHKAVFGQGIDSPEAAGDLYHANYEPGWQGGHAIQAMPWEQFKVWAQSPLAAMPLEGRTLATGNRAAPAASDAEYLAALKAGDMEKAQRMVDEAAKAAGWNGSDKWKVTVSLKPAWKTARTLGDAITSPALFANFPGLRMVRLRFDNSLQKRAKKAHAEWAAIDVLGWQFNEKIRVSDSPLMNSVSAAQVLIHEAVHSQQAREGRALSEIEAYAVERQIKSADPITRDEAGNVIPLSQRFNPQSDSILYTSNRRAPAASYDAAKAEGEARAKKAAAVKRSSVLTQVAGQRVLFKRDAQSPLAAMPLEGRTLATGNRRAGIRAYHGTPHKVDKFTVEKIGTGEGAQAYGWGLYFAENKRVAAAYQKLADLDPTRADHMALAALRDYPDPREAAQQLRSGNFGNALLTSEVANTAADMIDEGFRGTVGNLYTVELLPNEDEFLDWDKPLSEQSEKVKAKLEKKFDSDYGPLGRLNSAGKRIGSGASIYDLAQNYYLGHTDNPAQAASEFFASLGIPGIRYLDGNSRDGGSGTSNYVIFDDSQVQIIEENGRALEPEAQQWADQVIAESRQQVAMGMDPRLLVAYAIKGARVLADGMKTLATWSAEMAKRFGDKVQPYLKSIWAALSGTQSSNDALSTSNRRAPAASYDAAKAEGEARAKKAAAVKRSSVLTQVAGQRVLFKRDARSFWADVVSGNIDRIDYYAPGFRNIWLDTEREMALARAAVNSLFETLNARARRGFGYPAWWKSKAVRAKWQEFQNVMLPTAARLEASGVNERGEFEFKDFMMRAGRVPVEVAEKAGLGVGDVMNVDGEALTLGPSFSVRESNATTGKGKLVSYHLLLRPVSAADQQATYRAFVDEWAAFPVAKELLDEFIMPGLDKGRFIGPRQFRTAEFNRYSLRDVYNEWPDALREQFGALPELGFSDGYVPEVPIKSGAAGIAGIIGELLRSYQSPARRFAKQGLRESGDVKSLFEGFQTQLMQAHLEKVRMERRGRLLKAAAVPEAQIPVADRHLWMPVNDAFEMVYEAVVLARNLDRGAFPALTGALNPEQVDLMRSIVGEAWMLRGRAMQIPAAIYNEMLAEVATAQTENLLLKLALWFMQQLNAASLASFQYLGMNFIGNEILKVAFAVQSGYKAMLFAMSGRLEDKARARLALSTARYLMQGAILDRFPLRRERFREILPREIFDTNHFYNALQGMDEGVLDNVKKLQFGSAFLAAVRAGNWDVGAKVQLANAMYQAYAREAWRDAAKRDVSLTRLSKEKKRQWLKDYVATAPATVHREVEMAAGEWLMNYENTPRWMNSGAIKPFIDPTKPGKMSQAVMSAQLKKLAIAAFIPFLRWSYLFVRKVKRTAIDEGVRNIVGATGNTREGIANLMALGTLVAAPAMLTFLKEPGGDDDVWDKVEAQLLGRSRDMEGKDLDRTLKATNRFNVSALARIAYAKLGFMEDYNGEAFTVTDNAGQKADVWLRYRNYPFIKEGIVLGLWLQALRGSNAPVVDDRIKRSTGNAAGNITAKDAFGQSWQALTGEYVSLGLGYTMLESVLAGAMSGSQSADAMNDLRNSTVDLLTSPVLPHRLMRDIGVLVDPTDRRSRPSARLGYDPGWLETFMARIPGLKSKLPLDGEVAAPTILSAKSSVPPAEQAELLKHYDIPATAVTYSKDRPSRDAFADLRMLKDLGAGPQDVGLSMSKTTKSAPKPLVAFPKPDQVRQRNRWIEALRMTSPINTLPVNQTAYRAAVTATEKKD